MSFPRYPAYKASGVEWLGETPVHWTVTRIKNALEEVRNGVWGDEPSEDNAVLCVRVADFNRQNFTVSLENPTYRGIDEKDREGRLLQRNDLLIEKSGGGENQPVGFVVIYNHDEIAVSSNFVARISLKISSHPQFLLYCFAKLYNERVNVRSIKQNTGIQNLDAGQYFDELITFPPLPEQRAIAAFLDAETARIDAVVAKQEALIATLQEKRRALISHAVTKGLDPAVPMKDSGVPWLGEVPTHWEVKRLRYISRINPPRSETQSLSGDTLVSFVPMEAIGEDCILQVSEQRVLADIGSGYTYFRNDDVIVAKITPCFENGKGALCRNLHNGVGFGTTELHVLRAGHMLDSVFLFYLTRSPEFHEQGEAAMYGAAGQQRVPADFIEDFASPLPPLSEQHAIVAFLNQETAQIDTLTAKAEQFIALLREHRAALIAAAVTGQIDVRGFVAAGVGDSAPAGGPA